MSRRWLPSVACLVWCAVMLALVSPALLPTRISGDGDFAQHLTLGRLMLEARAVLKVDPTLYSVGPLPWFGHEWLSELLFAAVSARFGLMGPVLLVSALVASACALMQRDAEERANSVWIGLLVFGLATPLLVAHLWIRPHLVTWPLAVLWQRRLLQWQDGKMSFTRWLVLGVPLMVLWCNLHGGFLLAFVLIAIQAAALVPELVALPREQRRPVLRQCGQLGLGAGCMLLASGLNPFGFALHTHLVEHLSRSALLHKVNEFKSPDFYMIESKPLLIWILLSFALSAFDVGRALPRLARVPLRERLLQLALLAMTLGAQRNAALYALLSAPTLARDLSRVLLAGEAAPGVWGRLARKVSASSRRLAALDQRHDGRVWAIVTFLSLLVAAPGQSEKLEFSPKLQPVQAVRYIGEHAELLRGRMFNSYAWGGYLAYALYPRQRCFVSGMADYYGSKLFFDYRAVAYLESNWASVLDQYRIDWILFEADSSLARLLAFHPAWRLLYRDSLAVIYVRARAGQP